MRLLSLFSLSNRNVYKTMNTISTSRLFGSSSLNSNLDSLISPEEAISLSKSSTPPIFIDSSWYLDKSRNPDTEYLDERIPSAIQFDMNAICDTSSPLPHMMPSAESFSSWATANGIQNTDKIVIYGGYNCFSAPRVWWTFKTFGHDDVCILNSGLEGYKSAGGILESGQLTTNTIENKIPYNAIKNDNLVVNIQQVMDVVESGKCQIVDARPSTRFSGADPEPRPGLERGHIPGSINLPFASLLDTNDKSKFKSIEEIRGVIEDSGIIMGATSITTCGSGVTACVISYCLHLIGAPTTAAPIYDGSFAEWGIPSNDVPRITTAPPNE